MALVWTKTANPAFQNIGFGSPTATFTSAAIGSASSDRIVVVGVGATTGLSGAIGGVTIGGVSATQACYANNGNTDSQTAIFYLNVTTGTTATIVVSCSGANFAELDVLVGILTGSGSAPTTTGVWQTSGQNDPQNVSITVPSSGIAIVSAQGGGGAGVVTWSSNVTGDYENVGSGRNYALAHSNTTGSITVGYSGYPFDGAGVAVAAWDASATGPAIPVLEQHYRRARME